MVRRSFFEEGGGDIYAARTGDTTLVPVATSPATEIDLTVSPDGRWIAYASDESGVSEVYVRPFPDAASARWQVSPAGGSDPVWSHSGREIFYRTGRNELVTVGVQPGANFSVGLPKVLFSTAPYAPLAPEQSYDVSPDDRRFLMIRETAPTERNELVFTENWIEEMKARARK